MSYTPTTWQTGDTITAAGLNKMEQGIAASGAFLITTTWDDNKNGYVLDKTPQEIYEAQEAGQYCRVDGEIIFDIHVGYIMGLYILAIDPIIRVEFGNTPPYLSYTDFQWDAQNSVVTETNYNYQLTPYNS